MVAQGRLFLASTLLRFLCIAHAFVAYGNTRRGRYPSSNRSHLKAMNADLNEDLNANLIMNPLSIGFIGCGTIAKAIATGLATHQKVGLKSISVSRRSERNSSELKKSFPDLVSVHDNIQDVLDRSEIVFLCVLPQQASAILQDLTFDPNRHSLISLVSTSRLNDLSQGSGLPIDRIYKMICLPSVARKEGISLILSQNAPGLLLRNILDSLGGYVECRTEQEMNAMMVPSGLMGSMYGILRKNRDWLVEQGATKEDASYFVGRIYWGMLQDAERVCKNPDGFDELIAEQTPGGLNEQALKNLDELGMFQAYGTAMDAVLARLEGRSDGSLIGDK